jgi:uncharacterized protein
MHRGPESSPASRRSAAAFTRLADLQVRHPWRFLAVAAVLVVVSLSLALRLEVAPGFAALLPESRPSVQELERVKQRTAGVSNVFVVLEGDDTAALRRAADAVVAEVQTIGRPWVGSAESGMHEALDFLRPRLGLFADLESLEGLHADVEERWQHEVGKATGAELGLDDYEPPALDPEAIKKRFGIDDAEVGRYPDGYYQSADGRTLVVSIRSAVMGTDYAAGNETVRRVREAVERVNPGGYHPTIRYGLSGDLVTAIAEYNAINDDLTDVGILGAAFIISVVFLYYLRMRTLWSMLFTIGIGVSISFGLTELLVGQLNMATGFLFTIIAGNGINPGIIFMARYLEARRKYVGAGGAIGLAHRDTWLPTLTASCAASAAYASLIVTEFRGFRDFGIIGGSGMIICWASTFLFLPPMLVIAEKVSPLTEGKGGFFGLLPRATAGGTRFGIPVAMLVSRAPRFAAIIGLVVTVVAAVVTVGWIQADPMEYDLKALRTDMSARAEEDRLARAANDITGFVGYDGMAILTDRPDQVPLLVAALERKRDEAPPDEKPFKSVHTLQELVPADQAAKIPLLRDIADRVERLHERKAIDEKEYAEIAKFLPPKDVKPFGLEDLPDGAARPFTEADGRRGRIVYIAPISTDAVDDAKYLFRWADSYRHTELPDGSVVKGSGRAVIYADIWEAVVGDIPKAVSVAMLMTLFVVGFAFRRGFASAVVMGALIMGVLWMTGLLAAAGVRLNFLNFIALPITFGIGVDYAVNIMQRYRREGAGGALVAVKETGGAVILCSLTTTLGYLALVRSTNHAVRSLGVAAVLGEVACLLAAVIVLPGALVWLDHRRTGVWPSPKSNRGPLRGA